MTPGDIVDDKLLGAVLSQSRQEQIAEDEEKLRDTRSKRELRVAMQRLVGAGAVCGAGSCHARRLLHGMFIWTNALGG